jgi:hypothetical protein
MQRCHDLQKNSLGHFLLAAALGQVMGGEQATDAAAWSSFALSNRPQVFKGLGSTSQL